MKLLSRRQHQFEVELDNKAVVIFDKVSLRRYITEQKKLGKDTTAFENLLKQLTNK
jgi:hypothetical protein